MNPKKVFHLILVAGVVFGFGNGCETTGGGNGGDTKVAKELQAELNREKDALKKFLAEVVEERDKVSARVRQVREKVPAGSNEAIQAELLYEEARGAVNSMLFRFQLDVQEIVDPTSNPDFKSKCEEIKQKVAEFKDYARRQTVPGDDVREKFFDPGSITASFVFGLGSTFFEKWSAVQKAKAETKAKRSKDLKDMIETVKWTASFKEVK